MGAGQPPARPAIDRGGQARVMAAGPEIVVLGTVKVDVSIPVGELPAQEEEMARGEAAFYVGGKGANQALAVAQGGGRPLCVSCVGDDTMGRALLHAMRSAGLNTDAIRVVTDAPTAVSVVMVAADGQNRIVTTRGAPVHLGPDDVRRTPTVVRAAAILAHAEINDDAVETAFLSAPREALRLYTWAPVLTRQTPRFSHLVDLLIVNAAEASTLTGKADPRAAARRLRADGWRRIALTLGAQGLLLVDEAISLVPALAVTPMDTTGAGDVLVGALALAWLQYGRNNLRAAVDEAMAQAGAYVAHPQRIPLA